MSLISLMLGIYSKKDKINAEDFKEVIEDFSLYGKRKLETRFNGKILLSSAKKSIDYSNIVENEDKSLIILFGGKIYDFDHKVKDLIKKGHKFKK